MSIEARLVENMGSDVSVVNAARVSFGVSREGDLLEKDERLIKFLAREHHVTPFRHPQVTLRCKAPIAIARQLGKHQAGFSWNELSRRYKDGDVEVFFFDKIFKRPENLHSGSGEVFENGDQLTEIEKMIGTAYGNAVGMYESLLSKGVAPEQARFVLPQGMITEWVWTGSLYGWSQVYAQRISEHAQYEVRLFAEQVDNVMKELYPVSWEALKESQVG